MKLLLGDAYRGLFMPGRMVAPVCGVLLSLVAAGALSAQQFSVTGTTPAPNAVNVSQVATPSLTFSTATEAQVGTNIRFWSAQRGGLRGSYQGAGTPQITFTPAGLFQPGEVVSAQVSAQFRSAGGVLLARPRIQQFTVAAAPALGSFAAGNVNVNSNDFPNGATVADFNGDGLPDVATGGLNSGVVLLGDGTGQLSPRSVPFDISGPFLCVAAIDVDNDGDLDLLGPRARGTSVQLALNNGNGQFAFGGSIPVNADPRIMAASDFDGDGNMDFVTACRSGSAQVSFGNGRGGFTSPGSGVVPLASAYGVATGDVDGDGDTDFVVCSSATGAATAVLNNGNRTFTLGAQISIGSNAMGVTLGDVNQDGHLDVLVANNASDNISVALGNGNGTFQAASLVAAPAPLDVALGDVDGDGDLDLVASNYIHGSAPVSVSVRLNDGQGGFSGSLQVPVTDNPTGSALADFNGDGTLDLVASTRGQNVCVRLNESATRLTASAVNFCTGDAVVGTLSLTPTYGTFAGFQVGTGSGFQDIAGSDTSTTYAFANLPATTSFRAVLRNLEGRLFYSNVVQVAVNPRPVVTLAATSATTFCGAGTLVLQATPATGGHTYQFFRSGTLVSSGSAARLSTAVSTGGAYTVAVTTPAGCTTTSAPVNVTVNPVPATPVLRARVQADGTVRLTTGAADNLFYRYGQTAPVGTGFQFVVSGQQSGYYSARAVSSAGCVSGESASVFVVVQTPALAWTGATSSAWNDGANWAGGSVPPPWARVQIPAGSARLPEIPAGTSVQVSDMYVATSAALTVSGGTLSIAGYAEVQGALSHTDGTLRFNGTTPQVLSTAALALGDVTVGAAGLTLEGAVSVRGVLTLQGNLASNGALTLVSDAAGTALVVNAGGVVQGTATVQRYIAPTFNAGPGYRHFASPVTATTVVDLTTLGFAPVVNPAYNTSATPNLVMPFPTVFAYDEARLLTSTATAYAPFDQGWFSPAALSTSLTPGRGYTVNLAAAQTVDFVGTLTSGTVNRTLTRSSSDGGWHLVGNPYPSPMDWSRVQVPTGLDNAIYVHQSTTQYGGAYLSYVNGVGNPIVAMGQGFFVRVSPGTASVTLPFTNAARVTSQAGQPVFQRTTETRPVVQLTLRAAGSTWADEAYVYFEAGATAGVDSRYDAVKLPPSAALPTLSVLAAGTELSINGLPALTSPVVVPLRVVLPAGTYTLEAAQLLNLNTMAAYLHDAVTGQDVDLHQQPRYTFTAPAAAPANRFELRFTPARPMAAATGLQTASIGVYPNPAQHRFTVQVPAVPGAAQLHATLFNSLGQKVREHAVALPAGGAQFDVDVTKLAAGVYTLHLQVGDSLVTKRVVVE